jgi:hypothetical protein
MKPIDAERVAADDFGNDDGTSRFVIHGTLVRSPGDVTLVGCHVVDYRIGAFSETFEEQHFGALYMFGGGHLDGEDGLFTGLRVRFRNLETWAGVADLEVADEGTTLKLHRMIVPAVNLGGGGVLGLYTEVFAPLSDSFDGRNFGHQVWFEVLDTPNLTWSELDRRIVTPLHSLLTMCVGEGCPVVDSLVRTQAGEWVEVSPGIREADSAGLGSHRMAVRLAEVTLAGVGQWLDSVEKLGPLPPVIANSIKASTIRLETELLELTTVAEGLHARLFAAERRIDDQVAQQIRDAVKGSLTGELAGHVSLVLGSLRYLHDPSYKARLRTLVEAVSPAMPGVVGDVSRWVKHVDVLRNSYAHRRAGFIDKQSINDTVGVVLSRAIVNTCGSRSFMLR